MFKYPRHEAILSILHSMNSDILSKTQCYFGGGTAIALSLNEYRESVDIDFLCSSAEGYRDLRNIISDNLGELMTKPVKYLRDVRTDQYKIFTVIESQNIPVKLEIVREARISLTGCFSDYLKVPVLSQADLFTQKLLANADRGLDRSSMSRDIIDLAFMINTWGNIPLDSWDKAISVYGDQISKYLTKAVNLIQNRQHLDECIERLSIAPDSKDMIVKTLLDSLYRLKNSGAIQAQSFRSAFGSNESVVTFYEKINPALAERVLAAGKIDVPGVGGGQWNLSDEDPEYLAQLFAKATGDENSKDVDIDNDQSQEQPQYHWKK